MIIRPFASCVQGLTRTTKETIVLTLWARTISSVLFSTIRIEWCGEVGFVFVSGSTCLGLGTYCTRVVFIWWCVLAMKNIFVTRGIDWNLRTDVGKTKIKTEIVYDFLAFFSYRMGFDVWLRFFFTDSAENKSRLGSHLSFFVIFGLRMTGKTKNRQHRNGLTLVNVTHFFDF